VAVKSIYLRAGKRGALRPKHPWIFKTQIQKTSTEIKPGDIVNLFTAEKKFIGRGYYNPKSEISARILSFEDRKIDKSFFAEKIKNAVEKRGNLLKITNAYRAVFSEADELPGLIVDLYNDTAVFQVLTLGMEKFKSEIADVIDEIIKPAHIYEKSSSPFRKLEGLKDITGWWGDEGRSVTGIFEGKAKFLVDIGSGHKTGFYLDQRKSRLGLEGFCKDKTVLDLFCYTGGFSIAAAINGASKVRGIDIKNEWLELAAQNAQLNAVSKKVELVKKDAFETLKEICDSGEKFDVIIIDPPSFLKTRESLKAASKGYSELNTLGMKAMNDGGILATFSCSYNMPNQIFADIVKKSALSAGKKFTILKRCHQAEDHPIVRAIPETEYLKGYFLKIGNQ
jgi:23S rRNA (cytosine1962-C5)-methyltransferase